MAYSARQELQLMNNELMFSSKNQKWQTRDEYFLPWQERFNFTLDVCASDGDQKCEKYFNPEQDGLKQDWTKDIFWCNPEYNREQIKWVQYGVKQKAKGVFLLPSRTDTKLFHDWLKPHCKIEFIKGRLIFGSDEYWSWLWDQEFVDDGKGGMKENPMYQKYGKMNAAPFPSLLAILNF